MLVHIDSSTHLPAFYTDGHCQTATLMPACQTESQFTVFDLIGARGKFVLYHYCQKIIKWAIISENKVNSQEKDRQVGNDKWK